MRRLHEIFLGLALVFPVMIASARNFPALWPFLRWIDVVPDRLRMAEFVLSTLLALGAGLVLVWRSREEERFLPTRSYVTFTVSAMTGAFMVMVLLNDILHWQLQGPLIWLFFIGMFVGPSLAWRWRRHGEASALPGDAALVTVIAVIAWEDALWYLGPWQHYNILGRVEWWLGGKGLWMTICLALGVGTAMWWRRRRPRTS